MTEDTVRRTLYTQIMADEFVTINTTSSHILLAARTLSNDALISIMTLLTVGLGAAGTLGTAFLAEILLTDVTSCTTGLMCAGIVITFSTFWRTLHTGMRIG